MNIGGGALFIVLIYGIRQGISSNKVKLMKRIFAIFFVFFMAVHGGTVLACALPVCNIPQRVEELRNQKPVDRFNALGELRKQNRNSKSPAVWRNLYDFSTRMYAVTQELKDEDWVIREAQTLQSEAGVGLIRFQSPKTSEMVYLYRQLMNEGYRFQVINYWVTSSETLTSAFSVRELIAFAQQAEEWSVKADDPEYVFREIASLHVAAAKRLATLDPFHEGTFRLVEDCSGAMAQLYQKKFPGERPCEGDRPQVSDLYLLESTTAFGLIAAFFDENQSIGEPRFIFQQVIFESGVSSLRNNNRDLPIAYQIPAEFFAKIDPQTGNISGWIRDTRTLSNTIFKGTAGKRTVKYFRDGTNIPRISLDQIEGVYLGKTGQVAHKLIVKRFRENRFTASLFFGDAQRPIVVDYQMGSFLADRSYLNLVRVGDNSGFVKLILGYRKNAQGQNAFGGYYYSVRNGVVEDVEFVRQGSVQPQP